MRKLLSFICILTVMIVFEINTFAADAAMTLQNNILTVENVPKDSSLFTVSYKDSQITDVSMVRGEGTVNVDISEQNKNADTVKAFLWDLKTLKPLTESKTISKSKILVASFSATGHTKPLAEYASKCLNADFYEIVPEEPYTVDDLDYNNSNSRTSKEQNDEAARPKIKGSVSNMEEYDTVIISHPIWWGQAPKIIYTFLESYDFSGKTITTMCTSASSPLGSSAENLKKITSQSVKWLESKRFSIDASEESIIEWLDKIGLKTQNTTTEQMKNEMIMKIDGETIPVIWEDNESIKALEKQAEQGIITVSMSKYGGWEQVGSLGRAYPSNDHQITAENGDIMLYSSNNIVLFYGQNTWSYTKLGKINLPADEIIRLLGNEDVMLTISLE